MAAYTGWTSRQRVAETRAPVTEEEKERGSIAGYIDTLVDGYIKTRPVASTDAAERLKWASMESHDELLTAMLDAIGTEEWRREFARFNKLVVDPVTGVSTVVDRVPMVSETAPRKRDLEETRHAIEAYGEAAQVVRREADARKANPKVKPKRYALIQVLEDMDVQLALGLSSELLQVAARQAIIDPVAACSTLQAVVRSRGREVVVYPGGFAKTLRAARASILGAVEGMSAVPPVVDMVACGDKVLCQSLEISEDGDPAWSVEGPVWRAHEVVSVARLATVKGSVVVNQLLESPMLTCGIQLYQRPLVGLPVADVVPCAGPLTSGFTGVKGEALVVHVRDAAERVKPVMLGDKVVGTAVQVTAVSSLVNWHVLETRDTGVLTVGSYGAGVSAAAVQSAGHDLWLTSHGELPCARLPWLRRHAVDGEIARLVYATLGGVEFSDVVTVLYTESGSVITTVAQQVRYGMSGAALVAETDGALLGVFHGFTQDKCVVSVLAGETEFTSDVEVIRQEMLSSTSGSDELYNSFVDRGLGALVSAVSSSVEPLYSASQGNPVHIACALSSVSGALSTTANPNVWQMQDAVGVACVFAPDGPDKYVTGFRGLSGPGPALVRAPAVSERVCLVGKDADGAYFSQVLSVFALENGSGRYWLDTLPEGKFVFTGAVVLALSDAAVLGQYVMPEGASGKARCVQVTGGDVGKYTPAVAAVQETFPLLNPAAWDVPALVAAVQLEPAVLSQYADIGRGSVANSLMLQLTRQRDESRVGSVQACMRDHAWVFGAIVDGGFTKMFNQLNGSLNATHGKLTEVFFSLAGMAAVFELPETFHGFVESMGLVDAVCYLPDMSPIAGEPRPVSWPGGGRLLTR